MADAHITFDRDRLQWAEQQLLQPLQLVMFPDDGWWCVQSRELDYAAGGPTKSKALFAWRLGFIADVLLHAMTVAVLPDPCPEDVWADLTSRTGAERLVAQYDVRGAECNR